MGRMKCVILVAGRGTRMGELTDAVPKPLLPIAGKTILDWKIEHLPDCIDGVVLVVNYLSEQFVDHMKMFHPNISVEYAFQPKARGTYDAVRCAKQYVAGSDFLVLGGDDLFDKTELTEMIDGGYEIGVQKFVMEDRYDVCDMGADEILKGFRPQTEYEKIHGGMANTGSYVLRDYFFELPIQMSGRGEESLPHTLLQPGAPEIRAYEMKKWFPINTPEELLVAEQFFI